MSIWGKIVGGTAGLLIGGPLGAILGALAGHYAVDRSQDGQAGDGPESLGGSKDDATRQVTFTIGVIALCAKMAKADGQVSGDEIAAFQQVFHVPESEIGNVRRVFNLARQDPAGYEAYAKQIARMFTDRPQVLEDLMDGLFHIAKADGALHAKEEDFLRNVAGIFGFDAERFERIKASHFGGDKSDPYTVLGIDRGAGDDEVKAAYRRIVKENHPDALQARGVPEEFVELANDKLAAINAAYDRIEKERGLA